MLVLFIARFALTRCVICRVHWCRQARTGGGGYCVRQARPRHIYPMCGIRPLRAMGQHRVPQQSQGLPSGLYLIDCKDGCANVVRRSLLCTSVLRCVNGECLHFVNHWAGSQDNTTIHLFAGRCPRDAVDVRFNARMCVALSRFR